MKDMLKKNKGVSLVSLSIAVIIIIAITGMIIYKSHDSIEIKNLTNMYNDISNLRDKITEYYAQYGAIPATQKYTNTSHLDSLKGANDGNDFYVIDLNMIDGLTLNYGQDYEEIKGLTDQSTIDAYDDVYIINYNSHNIFYVRGINYKVNDQNKTYYTDIIEPDVEKVKLKYIDGVRIPDDADYIEGDKNTGLIIEQDGTQYVWEVLDTEINSIEGLNVDASEQDEFLRSANAYEGFYIENVESTPKDVIYLPLNEEDNWIYYYDEEGIYRDDNGDEAYIPAGFYVSATPSLNKINKGLVISDDYDNEYVWIQVPKEITIDAITDEEIENSLKEYTKEFREEGYEDIWYDGCGLTETDYNAKKSAMLNSIKENGGFYIARYEMGVAKNAPKVSESIGTIEDLINTNGLPVSQKDQYPYNYVTCSQAEQLSERIAPEGRNSSLMFGIQWDLVLKFFQEKGGMAKDEITVNSGNWGNYYKTELPITSTNVMKYTSTASTWSEMTDATKISTKWYMLTTGASDKARFMNVYDLAGNVEEFILEKAEKDERYPCTQRGGHDYDAGDEAPACFREYTDIKGTFYFITFRTTIY